MKSMFAGDGEDNGRFQMHQDSKILLNDLN